MSVADTVERRPVPSDVYCNGWKRQGGGLCRQPAGWGTNHTGTGRCRDHGGSSPGGVKHAFKAMALEDARVRLGMSIDIDPAEAILALVCEAAGNVVYYRSRLAEVGDAVFGKTFHVSGRETGEAKKAILVGLYDEACDRLARYAKQAHDMGCREREVRVAERQGELIERAIAEALGDPELGLSDEQRAAGRVVAARHLRAISAHVVGDE